MADTFHGKLVRALREARDHGSHADARNLQSLITMLHEGRFEEMPATIARLRPIFRDRIGEPPADWRDARPASDDSDGRGT